MKFFDQNSDLFVLDIANNHQGDVEHGKRIIREHADVASNHDVSVAFKFQFRNLPDFVHKGAREQTSNKHIPRFLSTQLTWDDFSSLRAECRSVGALAICTPFDEESVQKVVEMNFDIIKVASCSAQDWPLLTAIAESGLPVIFSTGGLEAFQIDELVSFFTHRGCQFAIMHCVSIYPTPDAECNLLNIRKFGLRYPGVKIGWSTHEGPDETAHVGLALACGSSIFERHIGVATDKYQLNAYSSSPCQISQWLDAYKKSKEILGALERKRASEVESKSILDLKRGVYLKQRVKKGSEITESAVYFAFPCVDGQITSGNFLTGGVVGRDFDIDCALMAVDYKERIDEAKQCELVLKRAIHQVKGMLAEAKIVLGPQFDTEYSHHNGILNFNKVGAVLITIVNRAYAKKLLIQIPGQTHPTHMHELKEETFVVISGSLNIWLDEKHYHLKAGDQITVLPGVWHRFQTDNGCIFEEISTTAHKSDSRYQDPYIDRLSSRERKTKVDHWGRFQIVEQLMSRDVVNV
jgi:sialic acid synthase SpsE/uncharacterized cupin superfamily protein